MTYIALYREWRPKVFEEVVGQQHITTTLKNSIKNNRIAHAYLFCGIRGTGKTSTAKIFAKALNCEEGPTPTPCNECRKCKAIDNGRLMDVIEIDAASNRGIDEIRELRDKIKYPPSEGRYKVYIIDEVHMLTKEAFNALLKTLEEPPQYVVFILATTEPHRLPETILSRCQRYDFKRLTTSDIINKMREILDKHGLKADDQALAAIARNSQGAMRDALSLLDQCISYADTELTKDIVFEILGTADEEFLFDFVESIRAKDLPACLAKIDELAYNGKDLHQFVNDLLYHFRNLMVARVSQNPTGLIDLSEESIEALRNQSRYFKLEEILRVIDTLSETERDVKWASHPRIPLEMALVKLTKPEVDDSIMGIVERINRLERCLKSNKGQREPSAQTSIRPQKADTFPSTENSLPKQNKKETGQNDVNIKRKTLEELQQIWPQVIARLKQEKPSLKAFIQSGNPQPVEFKGKQLVIGVGGMELNKTMLERNIGLVEKVISEVYNGDLKAAFRLIKQPAPKKVKKDEQELIQQVISVFGENLVEIEE